MFRYSNGLTKLHETADAVDTMKQDLIALQPKLKIAQTDTEALLLKIEVEQKAANVQKNIVQQEEAVCANQAKESKAIATDCEENLAKALPALAVRQSPDVDVLMSMS